MKDIMNLRKVREESTAASNDDLTLGDIEEQEMWEEHTRERIEQMAAESAATRRKPPLGVACLACWMQRVFGKPYPMVHTGRGAKCPRWPYA